MSEQDWEKRAQALLMADDGRFGEWVKIGAVQHALQLGREMADARSEEIAKEIEQSCAVQGVTLLYPQTPAGIARSFISKPVTKAATEADTAAKWKPEAWPGELPLSPLKVTAHDPAKQPLADTLEMALERKRKDNEAAIRADERGKYIAAIHTAVNVLNAFKLDEPALLDLRSHLERFLPGPKSREQVLEEALRELEEEYFANEGDEYTVKRIANRALEWKP